MGLLIIDDQKKIAAFIKHRLELEQYEVEVSFDGETGFKKALSGTYSLIILDLNLPQKDGLTVIRDLRAEKIYTPVLILSARSSVEDIVAGLDAGADGYITKPFAFDELLARVQALLRRSRQARGAELWFADLGLDPIARKAWRKDKNIPLTETEYSLLEFFIRNPNQVLSRSTIVDNVWPHSPSVKFTNIINVYVNFLRKKIDRGTGKNLIHSVPRTGYIMKET